MRDADPRRAGHRLAVGRMPQRPGERRTTGGACSCDPLRVQFRSDRPPTLGGLREVRRAHERHIEQVEGPPLPPLTRAQVDALLSHDEAVGGLTAGRWETLRALERAGLARYERPLRGEFSGRWVPTVGGWRVIEMLRRARPA